MKREYRDFPILTVGGIIFIDNKAVLIKRKHPPEAGRWTIPGGRIRVGERIDDALKREILEETGIEIEVKRLVEVAEKVVRDDNDRIQYHYIILDYLCEFVSGKINASSDAEEVRTVNMEDIDELDLIDGTKEVITKGYEFIEKEKM